MAKSHKTCMAQEEIIDTFGTYQGPGGGGQENQSGSAGFQANPKQLEDRASYHVSPPTVARGTGSCSGEPSWP